MSPLYLILHDDIEIIDIITNKELFSDDIENKEVTYNKIYYIYSEIGCKFDINCMRGEYIISEEYSMLYYLKLLNIEYYIKYFQNNNITIDILKVLDDKELYNFPILFSDDLYRIKILRELLRKYNV
jgi:hypothetical protein